MEESKASTAAEILAAAKKVVTLPSGFKVEIRRVPAHVIAGARGSIPDLAAITGQEQGKAVERLTADPRKLESGLAAAGKIIQAGCVAPSFAEGNPEGLQVQDLPLDDQGALLLAILEHAGWSRAAAREVAPLSGTSA